MQILFTFYIYCIAKCKMFQLKKYQESVKSVDFQCKSLLSAKYPAVVYKFTNDILKGPSFSKRLNPVKCKLFQ